MHHIVSFVGFDTIFWKINTDKLFWEFGKTSVYDSKSKCKYLLN